MNNKTSINRAANSDVIIPDANLNEALHQALGLSQEETLTAEELASLETLNCRSLSIESIEGLEYCTHLTDLDISLNLIYDVSPLENLSALTKLNIAGNPVSGSDLSVLGKLVNLIYLDFSNTRTTNIEVVSGFTKLTELYFDTNLVHDISVLSNISSLKILSFYENRVSSLDPLINLVGLTHFMCAENNISDLSPLAGMQNLVELNARTNEKISDISVLKNMKLMQSLVVSENAISDISVVAGMPELTVFYANSNLLSDVSPLLQLENLQVAELHYNYMTSSEDVDALLSRNILVTCEYNYIYGVDVQYAIKAEDAIIISSEDTVSSSFSIYTNEDSGGINLYIPVQGDLVDDLGVRYINVKSTDSAIASVARTSVNVEEASEVYNIEPHVNGNAAVQIYFEPTGGVLPLISGKSEIPVTVEIA